MTIFFQNYDLQNKKILYYIYYIVFIYTFHSFITVSPASGLTTSLSLLGNFCNKSFFSQTIKLVFSKGVSQVLITKGSSLRHLKNDAYTSIWKEKTKPSRLVRCRREASKGKHDSSFIIGLFSSSRRSISEPRSEPITARILLNLQAVKELLFEKDKTSKKTSKNVYELSKMLKFHLNQHLLKR